MRNRKPPRTPSVADIMLDEYFSFLLADEEKTVERKEESASAQNKADQLIIDEMHLWTDESNDSVTTTSSKKTEQTVTPQLQHEPSYELRLKPYAEPEEKLKQVQRLLCDYASQNETAIKQTQLLNVSLTQQEKLKQLMALATTPERKAKLALYQQSITQQAAKTDSVTATVQKKVEKKEQQLATQNAEAIVDRPLPPSPSPIEPAWKNVDYGETFQVLYFFINGIKFAAPLVELGTIQLLDKIHDAVWRPKWSLGLMVNTNSDEPKHIEVIDSAKWAMPNQLRDENYIENYRYILRLKLSRWSLAIDDLVGSSTVMRDQVNWRKTPGKRPWLAGIIKEETCVLLHVDAMIQMFEQGLDVLDVENK